MDVYVVMIFWNGCLEHFFHVVDFVDFGIEKVGMTNIVGILYM
jgi:hypothetical protein